MRVLAWLVCAVVLAPLVSPSGATAISRRKECRLGCAAAIDACVVAGGKRRRCKRQTLKRCRQQGIDACAVTTTTTSTTSPDVTTTTGFDGGPTTTIAGATSTTTTPAGTSTTTTAPASVNGCTLATATDLRAVGTPTVTFTSYAYSPKCARIEATQSITFSGPFTFHPLVGGTVSSGVKTPDAMSPIGTVSSGTSAEISFPVAGIFPFYCDNHGVLFDMNGAVFVDP